MSDDDGLTLGNFLRHRRGLITPDQVGLPHSTGRRVPGLRREELAIVAGISPDHYQRIEQGRVRPSPQTLEALASTLGLNVTERDHLMALGLTRPTPASRHRSRPHQCEEGVQELLDDFGGPAYVLNHRRDVLGWNTSGAALIADFEQLPPRERNIAWMTFTDPAMRDLYQDWSEGAQEQVAMLRRASGLHPEDQELQDLISRLTACSQEFVHWWHEQRVVEKASGGKTLNHPLVGKLELRFHTLHIACAPDRELFVYLPATPDAKAKLATLDTLGYSS